jgi:hypothetical protein
MTTTKQNGGYAFLMYNTSMVSLCCGVCKASRWRHRSTAPAHRHACGRNTVTFQTECAVAVCRCILYLQQYSRRLNFFFFFTFCRPALAGGTKNSFTKVLPTLRVSGYLVTVSVSVYIQIYTHRFASSPYLQLLTPKPYIKETYQYSCAFL